MIPGRLLNQFIAVAEELHFGRAAARLHMAQPPLSHAIKSLEDLVGVRLFERSKHFVALTPAGQAFLDEARDLLARGQKALDVARRASEGHIGSVTIGFVGSASYVLLPKILHILRRQIPEIHIDLRELASEEQVSALVAGTIDIGIVRLPVGNANDISMRTLATERFIAVLPKDHRLAKARSIRLKDLKHESFMVFPPNKIPSLHVKFLMACEDAGFSPRIVLEAWQMASMISLVAASIGIVLLPEQVRSSPHPGVVYKRLADQSEHLELKIALAWRHGDISASVRSILSVLDR